MTENITRCPKCNTSFRISESHLNTAKGSVRCGSCLNIFNAKQYLVSPNTSAQKQQAPLPQQEIYDEEEEILISDDMENEQVGAGDNDGYGDSLFNQKSDGDFNLFEREAPQEEEEKLDTQDESWALNLLEEDEESHPQPEPPSVEELEKQEEKQNTEEFEASYYTNSFQIIEDEAIVESEQQQADLDQATIENATDESDAVKDIFYEEEIEEYDYSEASSLYEQSPASNKYLDAIEPEPVEFDWQRHSNIWHSKLLWGALSLIVAALLVGQVAWIKFDTLSVIEPYRSYYAKVCSTFSCKLPDLIDRKLIKTANLVVRSHPKTQGALIVDAVLQNTARFEQTFPALDLVFTNQQDKTVAARRLKPSDYLAGELAGRTHMPVKQPIHIAIEIADPGREAVGYRISIAE
ncbi:zinc-ribbon and DUF3426 domain-containing protein [Agarilytica rhodophyticola]|uniref:zinc-ribbon and DUF3426 domain-containing protein n=1 Tax=Agarilytica rhodophyticola TaxID=1737490 RepID=UPI000B348878|nr:zinc-ribbon and DUF3426 domain-containing protein [Agarilytica rhodophyticola]